MINLKVRRERHLLINIKKKGNENMENLISLTTNEIGMITIPSTIRRKLDVKYKDKMEISLVDKNIIFKKITSEDKSNDQNCIRVIDEFGRIIVPKEMRNSLNIKNDDKINCSVDDDLIILKRA